MYISFDSGEENLINRIQESARHGGRIILMEQDVKALDRLFKQMKQANEQPKHFEVIRNARQANRNA